MAGPLSGISGQQASLQQAQATQQQQNQNAGQVRERDDLEQQNNEVQPQGAPAAEAQGTEANNQDVLRQQLDELSGANAAELAENAEARRGSLVDISV